MFRIVVLVSMLVAAPVASAGEGQAKSPSQAQAKGKDKAKAGASKVTAQQAMEVRTSKAKFMSAVGACARPEDCDPASPRRDPELVTMVERAEEVFVTACLQCASEQICEEERARIRAGKGRFGYNACMQGEPRTDSKATGTRPEAGDGKKTK